MSSGGRGKALATGTEAEVRKVRNSRLKAAETRRTRDIADVKERIQQDVKLGFYPDRADAAKDLKRLTAGVNQRYRELTGLNPKVRRVRLTAS